MSEDQESTCIGKKCPLWQESEGQQVCPNYMETTWINEKTNKPKILKDCAPKRSVFILMDLHNHIIGSKQYACETRNLLQKLNDDTREFIIIQTQAAEQTNRTVKNIAHRQNMMLEQQKKKEKHDIPAVPDLRFPNGT